MLVCTELVDCMWEDFKLSRSDGCDERGGSGGGASPRRSLARQDSNRTKTSVFVPLVQKAAPVASTPPDASAPSAITPAEAQPSWHGELPPSYPHSQRRRQSRAHSKATRQISGRIEYPSLLPSTVRAQHAQQRRHASSDGLTQLLNNP